MKKENEAPAAHPDREIVVSRVLDASQELAWSVMTDPKHVVHWWGPRGFSTTTEVMDVRTGGNWIHVMRGPDGTEYPNSCLFIEVVKPERLRFSNGGHRKGGTPVRFESTWSFDPVGATKTRVTIRMVFPTAEERDRVVREFGALEGAKQTLERMSEYMAAMPA